MNLTSKHCVPCQGGEPPLSREEITPFLENINDAWELVGDTKIQREFALDSFIDAIGFVNKIAIIAEQEGHHPDILVQYSKVTLTLWTHKIQGLHENDFILAAKIDEI